MPDCIPILTYHQIADAPPRGAAFRSLYVSVKAFSRQMLLLKLMGYKGLSMSELLPYLRGEKRGKVVGITFDDGYLNNLTNAMPVLQRYGFTSTCYIVSQLIGQTNSWDASNGVLPSTLMNAVQLLDWLAGNQEIGAHTRHHVNLPNETLEICNEEIAGCRADLTELLSMPIMHFCYPYGSYDNRHVDQVADAGYLSATTTHRGLNRVGSSLLKLRRVPISRSTTLPVFWMKVFTAYEDGKS